MFIIGQFFASLAILVSMIFKVIYFLLVIRIIVSWFQASSFSEPISLLYRITDPILLPLRRLPLQVGMIDFSPVVAFILISFIDSFVVGILQRLAFQFGGV
ncbi:MAG: YggT family protein [Candidatus Omnitrophica bacterium]|nr:YggT family protein [Candidatus Omnitrophota bacterium]